MFDRLPRPLSRGFLLWLVAAALPLRAAEPATGFVSVPGGKLYYEAQGEGPPLVLLHDGLDARQHRDAWLTRSLGLAKPPTAAALFELKSGFWINLHHFLYAEVHRGGEPVPAAGGPLSAADRQAWNLALAFYKNNLAGRDLLFDDRMVRIKNALAGVAGAPDLQKAGLSSDLQAALEAAAPVYRAHWWPRHDADNRAWIAGVLPRLARSGPAIAARLTRAYEVEWPATPLPVDVAFGAIRFGAYTTDHPVHTTLSSTDPREQGEAGLESLFHEASHGWDQKLIDAVAKAAADLGRPVPENLWHALLFYTVGEATRSALAEAGIPGYVPFAVKDGVYDRGMKGYPKAMEQHWQPYLDGKTDFTSAVRAVVAALPPATPPR